MRRTVRSPVRPASRAPAGRAARGTRGPGRPRGRARSRDSMSGAMKRSRAMRGTRSRSKRVRASSGGCSSGRRNSMPSAAASNSMARMWATLAIIGCKPARGEGRHRDMVFLVRARRQRIDAGRMRQAFVLAGQRGGGDVGDHEAAVQARVGVRNGGRRDTPESISIAMRPLGDRADLGDRVGHRVGGERHRLGVEVAAADHHPVFGEHQRVVGHRIGLAQQHERGMAQLVQAGAHDLRLAAQAIRVLDPVVAPRYATRGSRCRRAARGNTARRRSAPAGRAAHGCAGRTARRCRAPRPR